MKNNTLYILLVILLIATLLILSLLFEKRDGPQPEPDEEDPFGTMEYFTPEEFYEDYREEFDNFEDAEDYYYAHRD